MEDTKELEGIIRSLLVSNPKVIKLNTLEKDYEDTEGRRFPFRNLGFRSFLDYLKSIPHVVRLEPYNSFNPDVLPIVTKDISHINQLVTKQRSTVPKRRRTVGRRGGFNDFGRSGAFPRRRTSANNPPPRFMPTNYKGVYVSDIEKHIRGKYSNEHLSSNGIHSGQDLLFHTSEMVESVDQKVYPKFSYSSEIPSATKQQPESGQHMGIPAGMEEDFEDEYDDYDDIDNDDDHDAIKYDAADFDKVDEETVSNYTIQLCTDKLLNLKKNDQSATKRDIEGGHALEDEWTSEDHESTFSKVMINNFRFILAKYPEGIWATQLQQKYEEEFKVSLDFLDLGYTSAIMMVSHLPNVFTYEREGHDWKLFDARLQDKQVGKWRTQANDKTAMWGDKYVPESIYRNVVNLVHQYTDGIKSIYFLSFYEREYHNKLDVEELGFKHLEEFLEYFIDKITITKSIGHYLLLPKHKTRRLDQPLTSEEELNLPPNIEFLGPENVLKPNDKIPMQELPEIKVNSKNCTEPLIEMEVRVAEVMTPSYFFLMLDSNYNELESMMEDLEKFYNQEEKNYHILLPYLTENLFCVCKYAGLWHRAKITGILPNHIAEIEYIDYGTPGKVKNSELRFLHSDFARLPTQAICAKLSGITPIGGGTKWPKETCKELLRIVTNKRLYACVYHIGTRTRKEERPQVSIILYDTNTPKEIICNEYLVEKGLAEFEYQKSEGILEENSHTLNQNTSSSSQLNPPLTQKTELKPSSGVPPGFESFDRSDSLNGQYPVYPSLQQHFHHTNNFLFSPTNNNLKEIQQYILSNPHILNMQQPHFQQPHFKDNWSQLPYLPINPNYIPNPSTAYLPQTNMYFPPPSAPQNYYHPQAYNPLNINVNVQNYQNYNNNAHNTTLGKIPGYSGDLSIPMPAVGRTLPSPNSSVSQNSRIAMPDQFSQFQIIAKTLQSPKPLNTESPAVLKLERDEPSEQSPVMLKLECDEPSPITRKLECDEPSPIMCKLECDEPSPIMRKLECDENVENDKYFSDEDLTECPSVEKSVEVTPLNEQIQSSLVNQDNKIINTIPESWEDIDPDDTPAKADNFSEDFTRLLDFTPKEKRHIEPNKESSKGLISETNKINSDSKLIQTKSIENTVNWKEIFNPDNTSNLESNRKNSKITPNNEENIFKRILVEKIEFEDKCFHIIWVKSKYAVLAKEFYTQFVALKFNVIEKVFALRTNKEFPKMCRKDHQELFSELDKIKLYGETVQRGDVGRVGFRPTSIPYSYLSDIPAVLSVFHSKPDTNLLKIFKEWEVHSTTS